MLRRKRNGVSGALGNCGSANPASPPSICANSAIQFGTEGAERQVSDVIPSVLGVPSAPPDHAPPSPACSGPPGGRPELHGGLLGSLLLDGAGHWEALAGGWRAGDREGSLFIPPGLFLPPG